MGIRPYEMAIDRPPVGGDAHIAPPFSYHVSGGQNRPPLQMFTGACVIPTWKIVLSRRTNPLQMSVRRVWKSAHFPAAPSGIYAIPLEFVITIHYVV